MKQALFLLVFWLSSALAWGQTLEIDAQVEKDRVLFHGWTEDPSGAAIHLWDRERHTVGATQIEGAFLREDGAIAFRPAFPFLGDTGYVLIRRARGTETLLRFALPPRIKPRRGWSPSIRLRMCCLRTCSDSTLNFPSR